MKELQMEKGLFVLVDEQPLQAPERRDAYLPRLNAL
jgi:hypothetical protein